MTTNDENVGVFVQSFDVKTCNWITFDRFVNQSFYFLFTLIEETDWTVAAADSDEIFDCRYTVNNTLRNVYVSVESISNLVE